MKFIATLAAFAGAAAAAKPVLTGTGAVYTTVTETAYTTYCPAPTSFEFNHQTYTVTEATTLTITDCPDNACTYVKPIYTSTAVSCGSGDWYVSRFYCTKLVSFTDINLAMAAATTTLLLPCPLLLAPLLPLVATVLPAVVTVRARMRPLLRPVLARLLSSLAQPLLVSSPLLLLSKRRILIS